MFSAAKPHHGLGESLYQDRILESSRGPLIYSYISNLNQSHYQDDATFVSFNKPSSFYRMLINTIVFHLTPLKDSQ